MMEHGYDPGMDRLDVAVRALWRLARAGRWELVEELGLSQSLFQPIYNQACQEMVSPARDPQVFRLLTLCPAVLAAALETVRRYEETCGWERVAFYARLEQVVRG